MVGLSWNVAACLLASFAARVAFGCEDHSIHCNHWSTLGECDSNPLYMGVFCNKSCGKCPEPLPADCKDWCATGVKSWSKKCTWSDCHGCSECTTKGCATWCSDFTSDHTRCGLAACATCSACKTYSANVMKEAERNATGLATYGGAQRGPDTIDTWTGGWSTKYIHRPMKHCAEPNLNINGLGECTVDLDCKMKCDQNKDCGGFIYRNVGGAGYLAHYEQIYPNYECSSEGYWDTFTKVSNKTDAGVLIGYQGTCPTGHWHVPANGRKTVSWECCSKCPGGQSKCYDDCRCKCTGATHCKELNQKACVSGTGCAWNGNVCHELDEEPMTCTGWPTSTGTKQEMCENGNDLNDGFEYVYNIGRGTLQAACGPGADCMCCRRSTTHGKMRRLAAAMEEELRLASAAPESVAGLLI